MHVSKNSVCLFGFVVESVILPFFNGHAVQMSVMFIYVWWVKGGFYDLLLELIHWNNMVHTWYLDNDRRKKPNSREYLAVLDKGRSLSSLPPFTSPPKGAFRYLFFFVDGFGWFLWFCHIKFQKEFIYRWKGGGARYVNILKVGGRILMVPRVLPPIIS